MVVLNIKLKGTKCTTYMQIFCPYTHPGSKGLNIYFLKVVMVYIKLECVHGTRVPLLMQNSHILTNKSKKDIFMNKEKSLWKPWDDMDHFETWARHFDVKHCLNFEITWVKEQTSQIMAKFHKVLIKTIQIRERKSFQMLNFHKQKAIIPESMVRYDHYQIWRRNSGTKQCIRVLIKFWSNLFNLESWYNVSNGEF